MANPTGKGGPRKGDKSRNPNGRPKKEREEKYYEILVTACTPTHWKTIIEKAIAQAERGDAVARKFLADYLIGQPIQKMEHTGAEGGAMDIEIKGINYRTTIADLAPRSMGDSNPPGEGEGSFDGEKVG